MIAWGLTSAGLQHIALLGKPRHVDSVAMLHAAQYVGTGGSTYYQAIRTIGYPAALPEGVCQRIQAWLATKYGIALAS